MKSALSPYFPLYLAQDTKSHFSEEANVYVGIGRSLEFGTTVASVPDIVFSTVDINSIYRNLVGLKKIQPSDMQIVVSRRDWVSGTTYDQYEDHIDIAGYVEENLFGTVNANADTLLSGTATISSSNIVVGSGTSFNNYLFPGDQITIDSQTKTVSYVHNADYLIVSSNFSTSGSGKTVTLLKNSKTLIANSANFTSLEVGDVLRINTDELEVVGIRSSKVLSLNANLSFTESNVKSYTISNTYPQTANNFYVRNSRDQVFKCIFDNNDAVSTVEPTIDIDGQLPENPFIKTSDGYKWKYLYTIPSGLKQKFFNAKWMPVISDPAVVAGSVEGSIDVVEVLWGGSGHISGGNSNAALILQVTGTDGSNANLAATVVNGNITAVTILTGGNNYTLGTVTVDDDAKLGTVTLAGTVNVSGAYVNANLSNQPHFIGNVFINDIVVVNSQSRNVVSVVSDTQLQVNDSFTTATTQTAVVNRSDAKFNIQFSPGSGHGSNPAEELFAHTLMISTELVQDENDTIPVSQVNQLFDFNQVSLIQDPIYRFANNTTRYANNRNLRVATRLFVADPGTSNFVNDETVYVGTELESATGVANVAHWDPGDNYLYINNITGKFNAQDAIKGSSSGISIPILEVANSEMKPFTGTVLYAENRKNVVRLDDQIDQVKIILSF